MQPYFLPYIGYWQLINAVDTFVVYDNIQYTKKGWFNRNRYLQNNKDVFFTIPLKKDSDYLNVNERLISKEFNKTKFLAKFKNAYSKAPYLKESLPVLEEIIMFNDENLFNYNLNSIYKICNFLEINTKIVVSSSVGIDHSLRAQDKVIAICKVLKANVYINPEGGMELYSKDEFKAEQLDLKFIKSNNIEYKQFDNDFVPWLSIVDLMMFNSREEIQKMLNNYQLI